MAITVTRSSAVMIRPSESTPSGTLDLSGIDKYSNLGDVSLLFIFRHGNEAAEVIRKALSKALVPYYPLAGRLKQSPHGEVQIACTGEGVWFFEASADFSLDSVNYMSDGIRLQLDELFPTPPPKSYGVDEPLVQIQLTRFTCDGFSMGIKHSHRICDSLGLAQFLNAVGEFARGFQDPTVVPVWQREAIPTPPWLTRALREKTLPPPPTVDHGLQQSSIDISLDQINTLKKEFFDLTGKRCSSFDIVSASIWRHRTRAIDLKDDTNVVVAFVVNMRPFFNPPLPEGYYGNCLYPMVVTASSAWLVKASNAEVVKLIKDAKAEVPAKFFNWLRSDEVDVDPFNSPGAVAYTTLSISGWTNLGFNQMDCGWGPPVQVFPTQRFINGPIVILGSPPAPKKGLRLTTWCVNSAHLPSLVNSYEEGTLSRL